MKKHDITTTPVTTGLDARGPVGVVRITCSCGFVDKTHDWPSNVKSVIEAHESGVR